MQYYELRWLRGNDIVSGSVCFDFRSTNVVQLSLSENDLKRQSVTAPETMSLPLNHLPYSHLCIHSTYLPMIKYFSELCVSSFNNLGLEDLESKLDRLDVSRAAEITRETCASPTSLVSELFSWLKKWYIFCFLNCSGYGEKLLKFDENLQIFWVHWNNLFKQWKVRTIFEA